MSNVLIINLLHYFGTILLRFESVLMSNLLIINLLPEITLVQVQNIQKIYLDHFFYLVLWWFKCELKGCSYSFRTSVQETERTCFWLFKIKILKKIKNHERCNNCQEQCLVIYLHRAVFRTMTSGASTSLLFWKILNCKMFKYQRKKYNMLKRSNYMVKWR